MTPFHVDHIRARKHGGRTISDNLAYSCPSCNCHKGSDLASYDAVTQRITPLYNPRSDRWDAHFRLMGSRIVGRTAKGRTTVQLLRVNAKELMDLRAARMAEELF